MKTALLCLLIASASPLAGCVATATGEADGEVIVDEPPAPREEVVEVRPGFIFIKGHWAREHGRWAWRAGYWEHERAGQRWVAGHWDHRGRGHVWVEGRWER
jgi:hypothetical protein